MAVRHMGVASRPQLYQPANPLVLTPARLLEPTSVRIAPRAGDALRRCLVLLDVLGTMLAWSLALVWLKPTDDGNQSGLLLIIAVVVPVAVLMLAAQRLYRARVCSVRSVETEGLVRTAAATALLAWVVGGYHGATVQDAAVGAGLTFILLRGFRSAFAAYLHSARRKGHYTRPVLLVGANEEADGLNRLLSQHPELGFEVVGYLGESGAGPYLPTLPYLGTVHDTAVALAQTGADGVIVAVTAVGTAELNRLTRELTARSVHVHLSSGVRGISQSRLRPQPLAHEPLFYVEPAVRSDGRAAVKRGIDVVLAAVGLTFTLPVLTVAAIAIKLQDGGPILFRQARVGRDGRHFTMLKLRTMVPDAEGQYQRLAETRAGRSGPLVKLRDDPRITRVGHFLRSSSIDELPQLWNVLTGSMSMVGPRPNLLIEAAGLDQDFLLRKAQVRPGITGLWQVEGRDNPSFDVYRRLDLFYLENWSLKLDAVILMSTVRKVLARSAGLFLPANLRARLGSPEATAIR